MEQLFADPEHCCILRFFNCGWEHHYQALVAHLWGPHSHHKRSDAAATGNGITALNSHGPRSQQALFRVYAVVTKDQNLTIMYIRLNAKQDLPGTLTTLKRVPGTTTELKLKLWHFFAVREVNRLFPNQHQQNSSYGNIVSHCSLLQMLGEHFYISYILLPHQRLQKGRAWEVVVFFFPGHMLFASKCSLSSAVFLVKAVW